MGDWGHTTEESRKRWETNADFYDQRMGDEGNRHSTDLVFPDTERYLCARPGERILEIACGNGTFSRRLARAGCHVVACDYSRNMIARAMERSGDLDIDYRVADATDYGALTALGKGAFDRAVCNMGVHDISDIGPMFRAVRDLVKPQGVFVFSVMHPCFRTPRSQRVIEAVETPQGIVNNEAIKVYEYATPRSYEGIAMIGIPAAHLYYHRPISELARTGIEAGFPIAGISEPVFRQGRTDKPVWNEIPAVMIFKLERI